MPSGVWSVPCNRRQIEPVSHAGLIAVGCAAVFAHPVRWLRCPRQRHVQDMTAARVVDLLSGVYGLDRARAPGMRAAAALHARSQHSSQPALLASRADSTYSAP